MNSDKSKFFVCDCGDISHQFRISYNPDDDDWTELSIEILLSNYRGFWKRLWHGLKYAFGYKSRFGAFDEVLLNYDSASTLKDMLEEYCKNFEKKHEAAAKLLKCDEKTVD